jgi:hypothetical protein
VTRLQAATVYTKAIGDVTDSPPRVQGVQGIAEPLQVALRPLRDDVDVHGSQVGSLEPPGKAAEHDVDDVVLVECLAELAKLLVVRLRHRVPPRRLVSRTCSILSQ